MPSAELPARQRRKVCTFRIGERTESNSNTTSTTDADNSPKLAGFSHYPFGQYSFRQSLVSNATGRDPLPERKTSRRFAVMRSKPDFTDRMRKPYLENPRGRPRE